MHIVPDMMKNAIKIHQNPIPRASNILSPIPNPKKKKIYILPGSKRKKKTLKLT